MEWRNEEFDLGGVNHLALVCSDMKRTVEFYTQVLGMRLIKTINLPGRAASTSSSTWAAATRWRSSGSPTRPTRCPASPRRSPCPGIGEWTSAVGSMNHVAFNVPEERFLDYRAKLKAKGVRVSPHPRPRRQRVRRRARAAPGVFVRSFYFQDPDGILLEFACWRRVMGQPGDVRHEPKTAPTGLRRPHRRAGLMLSLVHVLEWRAAVSPARSRSPTTAARS